MNRNEYPKQRLSLAQYIKVVVRLKEKQRVDINHWRCTIHGELREVTSSVVEWYCVKVEDAIHSFKLEEIDYFSITGENINDYDNHIQGSNDPYIEEVEKGLTP